MQGVAPRAQPLAGKVLNDSSSGELFRIIAGMDWAVAEGADVISMSIGTSEPADCSDPMATDCISAGSGVLLVLAAGDLDGPQETITSPGCAAVVATYLTATTAYCPVGAEQGVMYVTSEAEARMG